MSHIMLKKIVFSAFLCILFGQARCNALNEQINPEMKLRKFIEVNIVEPLEVDDAHMTALLSRAEAKVAILDRKGLDGLIGGGSPLSAEDPGVYIVTRISFRDGVEWAPYKITLKLSGCDAFEVGDLREIILRPTSPDGVYIDFQRLHLSFKSPYRQNVLKGAENLKLTVEHFSYFP